MDTPRPFRFPDWGNAEQNLNRFLPGGAIGFGIKEPHVKLNVLAIILSKRQTFGCLIEIVVCHH